MPAHFPALLAGTAPAPALTLVSLAALTPVSLAALTAKQLASLLLAPPPQLLVDCDGLLLPHPLGVCRFVAQLLLLQSRGTSIRLCNVHPKLRGCLQYLKLGASFHLNG